MDYTSYNIFNLIVSSENFFLLGNGYWRIASNRGMWSFPLWLYL